MSGSAMLAPEAWGRPRGRLCRTGRLPFSGPAEAITSFSRRTSAFVSVPDAMLRRFSGRHRGGAARCAESNTISTSFLMVYTVARKKVAEEGQFRKSWPSVEFVLRTVRSVRRER